MTIGALASGTCSRPPRAVLETMIQVPINAQAAWSRKRVHCASLTSVPRSSRAKTSQQASQMPVLVCSKRPSAVRVAAFSQVMQRASSHTGGARRCRCKTFLKFCNNGSWTTKKPGKAMARPRQSTTTYQRETHGIDSRVPSSNALKTMISNVSQIFRILRCNESK